MAKNTRWQMAEVGFKPATTVIMSDKLVNKQTRGGTKRMKKCNEGLWDGSWGRGFAVKLMSWL